MLLYHSLAVIEIDEAKYFLELDRCIERHVGSCLLLFGPVNRNIGLEGPHRDARFPSSRDLNKT